MNKLTFAEITAKVENRDALPTMQRWLDRGDGIAMYANHDLDHPDCGRLKWVSYGSSVAQIETPEPPTKLPDIGGEINWRYQLVGVCHG
jgi:hypothetical protein